MGQRVSSAIVLAAIVLCGCGSGGRAAESLPPSTSTIGGSDSTVDTVAPTTTTVAESTSTSTEETLPPGEKWTTLSLHDGDPTLQPSRVLSPLTKSTAAAAAVSLDGLIVVAKPRSNGFGLYSLTPSGAPVDTGIRVVAGSSLKFGPHGDLFTMEPTPDFSAMTFSEYRPALSGMWKKIAVEVGPVTGECRFLVTPDRVGCPDLTGPAITLDPPMPFDRVTEGLLPFSLVGAMVVRTGGSTEHRWNVRYDVPIGTSCDSDTCYTRFVPGPDGSAISYPLLAGENSAGDFEAVFLLDGRSTAGAAFLEGLVDVLGVRGNELIGIQTIGEVTKLVAFDLTSIQH